MNQFKHGTHLPRWLPLYLLGSLMLVLTIKGPRYLSLVVPRGWLWEEIRVSRKLSQFLPNTLVKPVRHSSRILPGLTLSH
jgi:hypothetical protein